MERENPQPYLPNRSQGTNRLTEEDISVDAPLLLSDGGLGEKASKKTFRKKSTPKSVEKRLNTDPSITPSRI